jgi:integrase
MIGRYELGRDRDLVVPGELAIAAASGEWPLLIQAAYFTGQRLSDLVRLSWEDVNVDEGRILFNQRKTGRTVLVPIHEELLV